MTNDHRPLTKRDFALDIVRRLRSAGYQALWAGGCVRDQLLNLEPKDYDVATDAPPARIREIFGKRRTIAVGAAFGVITVIGPTEIGNVEVATFRHDAQYSDGRHPDGVTFSTPEMDAQRRDFTINGLFYDPLTNTVIDYVGGQEDLSHQVLRAIGDPDQRIAEDKLRMLRAVRFTATYDLTLDPATYAAIERNAHDLVIVSAERIADELRRMLVHPRRVQAIRLLESTGLLPIILQEVHLLEPMELTAEGGSSAWERTLSVLDALQDPTFSVALAGLLRELHFQDNQIVERAGQRWRLSRWEIEGASWLLEQEATLRSALRVGWPQLQRLLVSTRIDELLTVASAVAKVYDHDLASIEYCRSKLSLPAEELNPAPLITGDDLRLAGIPAGPLYRTILDAVRDAQLEKRISSKEEALNLAFELKNTIPQGK